MRSGTDGKWWKVRALAVLVFCLPLPAAAGGAGAEEGRQWTLEECQRMARENYPLVRQFGLIDRTEEFSVQNARRAYLPQVSVGGRVTYQSAAVTFPQVLHTVAGMLGWSLEDVRRDQYRFGVDVSQTIWDGGYARSKAEQAEAEGEISRQELEVNLYGLRKRVTEVYFGILCLEVQREQIRLYQELLQHNLDRVRSAVDEGTALQTDADMLRVEWLTSRQQLTGVESGLSAYRRVLSLLVGEEIRPEDGLERPQEPALAVSGINPGAGRPELALLDARQRSLDAGRRAVNASVMPVFGAFAQGFYSNFGLDLIQVVTDYRWTWNYVVGVRFQWNIGAFYNRKNELRKLDLAAGSLAVQRDAFLFESELERIGKSAELRKMEEIMREDDEIIALRRSIREASEAKYENGVIPVSELIGDITAEHQARISRELHLLEQLKSGYEMNHVDNIH